MDDNKFEQWAIVELMGHQRMAGWVTEQQVGGTNFVRVDVPAAGDNPAFTRLLGSSAIYAINPVTQEIATAAANAYKSAPISAYELPRQPYSGRSLESDCDDDEQEI
ncbi:acetyltransferase [Exilibacterium tricleocarpae]|uniref:Acetyltransferase n=1 Tax=Exilibacterium tricleocarpae TaxID=2591008 RepID=A0A545U6X9_9GAMM|nr:acetyltransferase [Exilibacterium tricleocarpae]TQV85217.1 acetyltransferase [Exilibacterium tricleocarpae]